MYSMARASPSRAVSAWVPPAQVDLGQSQGVVALLDYAQIAGQGELEATAHRDAVDGGDEDQAAAADGLDHLVNSCLRNQAFA
jgi:hypothetical protein